MCGACGAGLVRLLRLIKPPQRTREDMKTRKATMVIGAEARNDVGMKTRREVREAVLKEEKCSYFEAGKHIKQRWDKLSEEKKKDYQKS